MPPAKLVTVAAALRLLVIVVLPEVPVVALVMVIVALSAAATSLPACPPSWLMAAVNAVAVAAASPLASNWLAP